MILRVRDANGNVKEIVALVGEKGDAYVLTEADKQEIASMVATMLAASVELAEVVHEQMKTETWTFALKDGSTVEKAVCVE